MALFAVQKKGTKETFIVYKIWEDHNSYGHTLKFLIWNGKEWEWARASEYEPSELKGENAHG